MDCNEDKQLYLDEKVKVLNVTPTEHLKNKEEIELNKTLTVHLENKVKELHGNVRHITQLGMTWFAFFVTINYLTIGWLAKGLSSGSESINLLIICTVAGVFILQNGLGVVGIWKVRNTSKAGAAQVSTYENWLLSTYENWLRGTNSESHIEVLKRASIPANLYTCIALSLMIVLASLIVAWGIILFYYICK
jgi:hypothetical protein